jgi:hypothetical protein
MSGLGPFNEANDEQQNHCADRCIYDGSDDAATD